MKISVVLPVAEYNMEWLSRAIASTAGFADELIIVGDHDSAQFYNSPLIHQVVVVKQRGLAKALNAGVAVASHNWISFLCSDDQYTEQAVGFKQACEDYQSRCKLSDVYGGPDIYGGQVISTGLLGGVYPPDGNIDNLERECRIASPSIFRKDLWWNVRGYKDKRYLDWYFWKECIAYGALYRFFPIVMYNYMAWHGTIGHRYEYRSDLGHEWGDGPRER